MLLVYVIYNLFQELQDMTLSHQDVPSRMLSISSIRINRTVSILLVISHIFKNSFHSYSNTSYLESMPP